MKEFITLLQHEIVPAFGCTEPIALAFAAAKSVEVLGAFPDRIHALCSGNIIKNAKSVTIPNAEGRRGIYYSLVLGAIVGNAERKLEVLESLSPSDLVKADQLVDSEFCTVELAENVENLYIEVFAYHGDDVVRVIVEHAHTNLVRIEKNGTVLLDNPVVDTATVPVELDFNKCYDFADHGDISEIYDLIKQQLDYNMAIAEEGLANDYGANIGKLIIHESDSIEERARAYAAAGSDARMSGCSLPVMINCGSGNQGITLSVPILIYAKAYHISEERTVRALVLANMLALYIKSGIGRLSAYCGVVSSSSATVAAIAFLLGESREVVAQTLSNALAGTSGVICDGAKASCAMKIALALNNAFLGHRQAKTGNSFHTGDGIVKDDIDTTVDTIAKIAREGMRSTDVVILESMLEK